MNTAPDHVMDLIFGRWRSQILSAGTELAVFDHARENQDYAERFKQAMTSYSTVQSSLVLEALRGYDFSGIRTFCDVAGGYGHLMCALLLANPGLRGIVLDLPEVVEDVHELWATKLGLQQRCQYVAGDMFQAAPK